MRGSDPGRRRIVAGFLLLFASCSPLGDHAVVTIGSEKLTLKDLRREYADLPQPERPRLDTAEGRAALVERITRSRLLADHGRSLSAESPELRPELERERRATLVRRLITLEGGDPTPTEAEIEEAHERLRHRWRVERAWFPDGAAARAARGSIRDGVAFDEAVSVHGGITAGVAEWIEWTPFPDALADAVLPLGPGEVSEPFEEGARHVLAHVREHEEQDLPPLEDARLRITRGLRLRAQTQRVEALAQRLREEAGLRIDDEAIELLAGRTAEAILAPDLTEHDRSWAVPRFAPAERARVVAEWSGREPWTAADYAEELAAMIPTQRPRLALVPEIRALCLQVATSDLLFREALRRSLEEDWWIRQALRRLEQERFAQVAVERIEREVSLSPAFVDSVTAALQVSQPGLFQGSPRARTLRVELATREGALFELQRMEEAGDPGRWLSRLLGGEIRMAGTYHVSWLTPEGIDMPEVAERIFGAGPGALAGPVEFGGRWMLIACLDLRPARPLSEPEARSFVAERLLGGRDPGAVERWLEARREEVGVFVDEEALDGLAPGA